MKNSKHFPFTSVGKYNSDYSRDFPMIKKYVIRYVEFWVKKNHQTMGIYILFKVSIIIKEMKKMRGSQKKMFVDDNLYL